MIKKILISLVFIVLAGWAFAQNLPERPNPPTLVNDFANVLNMDERSVLEQKLVDFFAATSIQISVATVSSLDNYPIAEYAFRLGEKWGVGDSRFNNGILLLVKPKTAEERGEVFIAVGYGLEGVVPDGTSKRIVEQEIIPFFKAGDMAGGINQAADVLIELTKGEYTHQQYAKKGSGGGGAGFIIFIILIFVVLPIISRRNRGKYYSSGNRSSLPFWLMLGMMSGSGRNHSGLFGDFNRGSGSFGSSSGSSFGSFGGFGGGSFGGGGAGGSW